MSNVTVSAKRKTLGVNQIFSAVKISVRNEKGHSTNSTSEGEKRQPEIRLLFTGYPTKDIVRNKKEQQKKRLFYPKYFEVKPAQKIWTNIAMTSVSG